MSSHEIEQRVKNIIENFSEEEFIYDLLLAYGIAKASVTRLKKGDFNLSKEPGELLYKRKVFFKVEESDKLLSTIEELAVDKRVTTHAPRFAILTDYKQLVAKDLRLGRNLDIDIEELASHYAFFLPLAGSEVYNSTNDNEADRNAAYKMAQLYDELVTHNKDIYNSKEGVHDLNVFLSRLLFCYFAEDTGIFDIENIFTNTMVQHTANNGSDMHLFLDKLFDKLNSNTDIGFAVHLHPFPYVNGGLFRNIIISPKFNTKARNILKELGDLNWGDINPDIFGSMIQAVVIPEYRSELGMHYTSVPNIMKLIKPLFLDELYEAFDKCDTIPKLRRLILRLSRIKFFDPACGSGNFLIIAYKEIRLLEIHIIKRIIDISESPTMEFTQISLSQFYGIEIDDFANEMAILSLWLAEHQMNNIFEEMIPDFGKSKPILPLQDSGRIVEGNAARIDWNTVCPIGEDDEVYVMGNPPYLGSRNQDKEQKLDMEYVFHKDYKSLDYVSIWFFKGARYINEHNAELAFVSTNSVCQGLLVSITWPRILNEEIEIGFAYQSFKWTNSAKHNAGVTVIIVGLRNTNSKQKYLYTDNIKKVAKNINAYLTDSGNVYINSQNKSISSFPEMNFGNMPADGGHLLFTEEERNDFLKEEPSSAKWFKELISAHEFLNGKKRYCLWLENISDEELSNLPNVKKRVDLVYNTRLKSSRPQLAKTPHLFAQITQPEGSDFILIPGHSSERREYIPIGYFSKEYKSNNSTLVIATSEPWLFGVIHSKMHMVWVRAIGGKLKTDYRYSAKICYNTFPFPKINITQKENLNLYVFSILDERSKHPEKTMAQLYDPDTMPIGLRQAHAELDQAVERCYRLQPFTADSERLEYLFKMYEEMVAKDTLFAKTKKRRVTKK